MRSSRHSPRPYPRTHAPGRPSAAHGARGDGARRRRGGGVRAARRRPAARPQEPFATTPLEGFETTTLTVPRAGFLRLGRPAPGRGRARHRAGRGAELRQRRGGHARRRGRRRGARVRLPVAGLGPERPRGPGCSHRRSTPSAPSDWSGRPGGSRTARPRPPPVRVAVGGRAVPGRGRRSRVVPGSVRRRLAACELSLGPDALEASTAGLLARTGAWCVGVAQAASGTA